MRPLYDDKINVKRNNDISKTLTVITHTPQLNKETKREASQYSVYPEAPAQANRISNAVSRRSSSVIPEIEIHYNFLNKLAGS